MELCLQCKSLLKAIDTYLAKADEDLEETLDDEGRVYPDRTVKDINALEELMATALVEETALYIKEIQKKKTVKEALEALKKIKEQDVLNESVKAICSETFQEIVPEYTKGYIQIADSALTVDRISRRTITWIEGWSEKLGELMKLDSYKEIEQILKKALEAGNNVNEAARAILDSGIRDEYYKARRAAITEILRAHNVASWEAARQNPSVKERQWRHTGAHKNEPRENHVAMDGQIVQVDEPFVLEGINGTTYYPMIPVDPDLPPEESINCHCTVINLVDKDVLGLSLEERQQLQQQALDEMDEDWEAKLDEQNKAKAGFSENIPLESLTSGENGGTIRSIDVDDFEVAAYGKDIHEDVSNVIVTQMQELERTGGFYISEVKIDRLYGSGMGTPALQIEPLPNGLLQLNINTDVFSGQTLEDINKRFNATKSTVAANLKEALIHESGHAKSISRRSVSEIQKMYDELSEMHISGISECAFSDGAECLAETEVLLSRGESIPEKALEIYKKYVLREEQQ